MKIRHTTSSGSEKIELQMTPMIDIVFQLLVFFIMTFKIVSQEGDFNIKMPLAAPREGMPSDMELPPMRLRLQAGPNGELAGIALNDQSFSSFGDLHNHILSLIGDDRGPGTLQESAEVELDVDYNLRYEYTIAAITAVSGYRDDNDNIIELIQKVKFAPPRG